MTQLGKHQGTRPTGSHGPVPVARSSWGTSRSPGAVRVAPVPAGPGAATRRALRAVLTLLVALTALLGLTALPAQAARLDLHVGSRGTKVVTLEHRLEVLRLLAHRYVDRRYTSSTATAVRTFQRTRHLRVTGRVDQRTWDRVARDAARRTTPAPAPTPVPTPVPTPAPAAPTGPPPTIVGHRGAATSGVGENTVAALRFATDSSDVLEFDVRFTADGVPVLMHDATLDRTTTCTGPVAGRTLSGLAPCLVRATGPGEDQPVPTLDEAVAYAATAGRPVSPELKVDPSVEQLAHVVGVLDRHGLGAGSWVQSFLPATLARVHAARPTWHLVLLGTATVELTPAQVRDAGASVAGLPVSRTSASSVAPFHAAGLQVWSWTANTTQALTDVWRAGVDGVFTDIPAEARAVYHP